MQLPPVCHCKKDNVHDACAQCHITKSIHWSKSVLHRLTVSLRHTKDPDYSGFLQHIREEKPTQTYIDKVLTKDMYINKDQVIDEATEETTILCSHQKQVQQYNMAIQHKRFPSIPQDSMVNIQPSLSPSSNSAPIQAWAHEAKFHSFTQAAVGMRVLIYMDALNSDNASPPPYRVGDQGIITELHADETTPDNIQSVIVRLIKDGTYHTFTRTVQSTCTQDGIRYTRCTFPLRSCLPRTVPLKHNAEDQPDLKSWIEKDNFHLLTEVSIGSKVIITSNISLEKGSANGALGTVIDITLGDDDSIRCFTVLLSHNNVMQKVFRTTYESLHKHSKRYADQQYPYMYQYILPIP